jgi:hypothetical protein
VDFTRNAWEPWRLSNHSSLPGSISIDRRISRADKDALPNLLFIFFKIFAILRQHMEI